jgi:hypothetical protein
MAIPRPVFAQTFNYLSLLKFVQKKLYLKSDKNKGHVYKEF